LDREGPRGADFYIVLNVATECSRNYAKNIQLFTGYVNMTSCQIVTITLPLGHLAANTYVYCLGLLYESLFCHSRLTAVLRSI
jgi:hypothetical protein